MNSTTLGICRSAAIATCVYLVSGLGSAPAEPVGMLPLPAEKPQIALAPLPQPKPATRSDPGIPTPDEKPDEAAVPIPEEKPDETAVPLPVPRPDLVPTPRAGEQSVPADQSESVAAACPPVASGRIAAQPLGTLEHDDGCIVPAAFAVSEVGAGVVLKPRAVLNCDAAEALDGFIAGVVEPEARARFDAEIVAIGIAASFVCRTRNNVPGAEPSEHGRANAVDLSRFRFDDGRVISVAAHWDVNGRAGRFLRAVHERACGPFTTVIGPDGDKWHRDHFHLDLARRGAEGRSTWCQ